MGWPEWAYIEMPWDIYEPEYKAKRKQRRSNESIPINP